MTAELIRLFVEAGLVQFGRFHGKTGTQPFLISFDYLPAYPDVLQRLALAAQERLQGAIIHRLVAAADAVPFGVALALQTGLSLVYSRGSGQEAPYDLAGAYNIGHAAVLLTPVLSRLQPLAPLIQSAGRVGLEIHTVLAIVDIGLDDALPKLNHLSVLTLPGIVQELLAQDALPPGHARAVLDWLQAQRATLRRDAASP